MLSSDVKRPKMYLVDGATPVAPAAGHKKIYAKADGIYFKSADDVEHKIATMEDIAAILDSAPGALDTLNELAAALGDDANFATTVTNALALKAPLAPALQIVTNGATITPTFSNDEVRVTAQNTNFTFANPTGTAVDGWGMMLWVKDNGTPRTIAFGAKYRQIGVTLPTTTVASKWTAIGMRYNLADDKWDVVSVSQEA